MLVSQLIKSRNGLKRLVNNLQNVVFSNTHTHVSYSNSAARACSTEVQSPKCEKNLLKNCSRQLLSNICISFLKACAYAIRETNIFANLLE